MTSTQTGKLANYEWQSHSILSNCFLRLQILANTSYQKECLRYSSAAAVGFWRGETNTIMLLLMTPLWPEEQFSAAHKCGAAVSQPCNTLA